MQTAFLNGALISITMRCGAIKVAFRLIIILKIIYFLYSNMFFISNCDKYLDLKKKIS
jgi:hypothetical protein